MPDGNGDELCRWIRPRLFCDHLSMDTDKISVFCDQEEVLLSQPEYQLLLLLMENKGKTVTRKQLLEQVWDSNGDYVNDNTLTVTMKRLREKLHNPPCLKTIRSFGYRMEESSRQKRQRYTQKMLLQSCWQMSRSAVLIAGRPDYYNCRWKSGTG